MDGQVLMWTVIVIAITVAIGIPIGLARKKANEKQANQFKTNYGGIRKAILVNKYIYNGYWMCDFKVIYNNGQEGIIKEILQGSPQYDEIIRHV